MIFFIKQGVLDKLMCVILKVFFLFNKVVIVFMCWFMSFLKNGLKQFYYNLN